MSMNRNPTRRDQTTPLLSAIDDNEHHVGGIFVPYRDTSKKDIFHRTSRLPQHPPMYYFALRDVMVCKSGS